MITRTPFWKKIVDELKQYERSKKLTSEVMLRIKEIPQNESKSESD